MTFCFLNFQPGFIVIDCIAADAGDLKNLKCGKKRMSDKPEPQKLHIPEFEKGSATWWVQGRDTKSTSARRRAAKRRFYWVVFASIMLTVFGGAVFGAIIYWICAVVGPKDCDLFTPKAEIVNTFDPQHSAAIVDLIYSPDGLFLITASDDKTSAILDISTGEVIRRLEGHQQGVTAIAAVSLLPGPADDKNTALAALRVLTGSKDMRAIFWNPELNPPLQQRLGDDGDALSGSEVNVFEIPPGHAKAIVSVALSFDGRYALTGGMDNQFLLWDTVNRSLVKTTATDTQSDSWGGDIALPHSAPVTALAFNHNGNNYASGSEDCTIKIWDSNNDKLSQTLNGHNAAVTVLQYGTSGMTLLSAGRDQRLFLWDITTGKPRQILQTESEVQDAALTANEQYALSNMYDNSAVLWNVKTGEKIIQFVAPARISALAMSPRTTEDGFPLFVAAATVENKILIFSTASQLEKMKK